jgi:hypothetical protein
MSYEHVHRGVEEGRAELGDQSGMCVYVCVCVCVCVYVCR